MTCEDPIVHELGRMVVLFQGIESDLKECIHWILFPEDAGRGDEQEYDDEVTAITSGMAFRTLVATCFTLYAIRNKTPETPDLAKLRIALAVAEERRNSFLHSHWFHSIDGMHRHKATASARGVLKRHAGTVTLAEVLSVNQQLSETRERMFEFLTEDVYGL